MTPSAMPMSLPKHCTMSWGFQVVGHKVVELPMVGTPVVGAKVVGLPVEGPAVVGDSVDGVPVVGLVWLVPRLLDSPWRVLQ
jgi:hypothetical protein